jgi:hypothetical protein
MYFNEWRVDPSHGQLLDIKCAKTTLHAHALERIFELRPAIATHSIGTALNCKHPAQVRVVAAKDEIKSRDQRLHRYSSQNHKVAYQSGPHITQYRAFSLPQVAGEHVPHLG